MHILFFGDFCKSVECAWPQPANQLPIGTRLSLEPPHECELSMEFRWEKEKAQHSTHIASAASAHHHNGLFLWMQQCKQQLFICIKSNNATNALLPVFRWFVLNVFVCLLNHKCVAVYIARGALSSPFGPWAQNRAMNDTSTQCINSRIVKKCKIIMYTRGLTRTAHTQHTALSNHSIHEFAVIWLSSKERDVSCSVCDMRNWHGIFHE